MKLPSKQFIIGFISGGITVPFAALAAVFVLYFVFQDWIREKTAEKIAPPPFSVAEETEVDWMLQDLDGNKLNFSETKGKVVFLNFWSPTCSHCLAELPMIQDLYHKTRDDDIRFITVSVKDNDAIYRIAAEYDLTFPIYISKSDKPQKFVFANVPFTYIIDRQGKVAFQHQGSARWNDDSTLSFIRDLQKAPS